MRSALKRLAVLVLGIVLVLAMSACDGDDAGEDQPDSQTVGSNEESVETTGGGAVGEEGLAGWIEGRWGVDHELLSVDPAMMAPAADQPYAEWSCTVGGGTMIMNTDEHVYTGAFTESGETWSYDALSSYVDEEGITWTSHIVVDGVRTGDDSFTAEMWGEISSDAEGTLYVATWSQSGSRIE